jgi:hypothetical protein
MCEFKASVDLCLRVEAYLLEEDWQTSSDLQVTEAVFIYFYYLFCFTVVCHKALVIDSAVKVASATLLRRTTCNQQVSYLHASIEYLETTSESLYYRTLPCVSNLVFIELLQKESIPCEIFNNSVGILGGVREGEVVLMRKIKSIFQQ